MNDRAALERAIRVLEELERRRAEAPCLAYEPHEKQQFFHRSRCRRRIILGGNRSGKTYANVHEGLAHSYGYRFWEVPDLRILDSTRDLPPRDNIPTEYWTRRRDNVPTNCPADGMFLTGLNRERGIGQVLFPGVLDALPPGAKERSRGFREVRGPHGHGSLIRLPNGSNIFFAGAMQDSLTFEGFTLDWASVDEPIRQSLYKALWARLQDYMAPLWFTLTPLEPETGGVSPAWMYHEFMLGDPEDLFLIEVTQDDNPFLTDDIKRGFEQANYTDAERAARIFGKFQFLGNRVITFWKPDVHTCNPFLTPVEWIHGLTIDPHHRRPAFMLWWAYDPVNEIRFYIREWPQENFFKMRSGALTPIEYARLIREQEGRRPSSVKLVDPRFGKAEFTFKGQKMTSWVEEMAEHGADMQFDANIQNVGRIEYGLQKIRDGLFFDERCPVSPTNRPRIVVFNNLENTIKAIDSFSYKDRRDESKGLSEEFDATYKDPIDCIRYTELYGRPITPDMVQSTHGLSDREFEDWQEQV